MKDELYLLSLKSDDFGGSYKTAMDELDNANNGGTITNTKDALDTVYTSLKNAGVPLDELNNKLAKDFPNATLATKSAVDKNIVEHSRLYQHQLDRHQETLKQPQIKWQKCHR